VAEVIARETRRARVGNVVTTSLFLVFMFAYLFALFHFFGLGVALAACALIASRLSDLFWEVRTGERVTRQNAPWGVRYIIGQIFFWGALPLLWYSLCMQPS
jgi:Na+/melibiose symporter-like transporter